MKLQWEIERSELSAKKGYESMVPRRLVRAKIPRRRPEGSPVPAHAGERHGVAYASAGKQTLASTGASAVLGMPDIARHLGVSTGSVELYVQAGFLKGTTCEGVWTFSDSDFETFVANWRAQGKVFRVCLRKNYGDPWFFRTTRGNAVPFAGSDGRRIGERTFRRGGTKVHVGDFVGPCERPEVSRRPTGRTVYELRRRRAKQMAQYRNSGLFSAEELSLIEAYVYGRSLEKWGRSHGGTSRQAAWERVQRLEQRARAAGLPGWNRARRRFV